jgi:hypothetical protein
MDNAQEIRDIITQLQELQAQQSELLEHLEQLSEGDDNNNAPPQAAAAAAPGRYQTPRIVTESGYKRHKFPAGDPIFVIGN